MPAAGFALARGAISPSRARCPCHAACGMAILAMKERGQDARSRFCDGRWGHVSFTGKMPVPHRKRTARREAGR